MGGKPADAPAFRPGDFAEKERGLESEGGPRGRTSGAADQREGETLAREANDLKKSEGEARKQPATEELAKKVAEDGAANAAAGGGSNQPAPAGESSGLPPALQPTTTPPPPRPQPEPAERPVARKIIRNGEMAFEVDSFDSAAAQIGKIVAEEGGHVSVTDSEKLSNGKVKGTMVLRVPPDRLDTLVLKLRGLGDLKNQKINAVEVTRQYVDLDSQLKAAKAMEARFLDIIKGGKGEIKDLVEAEKQLGVYREKVERLEGELRYLDSLVSLSTLTVTLYERDIRTPTAAAEVEQVQASIETEDVERARAEAIKAIDAAKGRIIEAELTKHEAGQFAARVVADVPPDNAGPLTDRLKQIGKVDRLDVNRRQVTAGGSGAVAAAVKVERKDTRFQISLYNLANVAPRQTTNLTLAAADVEKAYRTILDQVASAGGRVLTSQLIRPGPDQTTGTITFQVAADKADVLSTAVRAAGDVMRLDVTQNADTRNVTEAKRGFAVEVRPLATVAPRETTTLQVAAANVSESFNRLLEAARAGGGRVITSQLNEQDQNNVTAQLDFDVMRENWGRVDAALRDAGFVVTRTVNRASDTENTVDSKVRLQVGLFDQARLQPRETVGVRVATRTVPESFNLLLQLARDAGGRAIGSQLNQQDRNRMTGSLTLHVPRENWPRVDGALKDAGVVVSRTVTRAADGPMTVDTKVGLVVEVVDERSLDARETVSMSVVTPGVADRYAKVLEVLRLADAQVYDSRLVEQGPNDVTGVLDFAIRREDRAAVEKALFERADVFNRTVTRSQDVANTLDDKVRMQATLKDADRQPARATYAVGVEAADVEKAAADFEAAAAAAGGRRTDFTHSSDGGKKVARVVVDVPLMAAGQMIQAARGLGDVTMTQTTRHENVPEGSLSRARVELTLGTPDQIVKADEGFGSAVREGLRTGLKGLFLTLEFVIVGLLVVLPLGALVWLAWRLTRRSRRRDVATPTTPTMPPPAAPPPGPVVTPA